MGDWLVFHLSNPSEPVCIMQSVFVRNFSQKTPWKEIKRPHCNQATKSQDFQDFLQQKASIELFVEENPGKKCSGQSRSRCQSLETEFIMTPKHPAEAAQETLQLEL